MKVIVAFGTRPELIKLAPVIKELRHFPRAFRTTLLATAQHREMLDQMLNVFNLTPDIDLDLMSPNQKLDRLTSRILKEMTVVYERERPDLVIIQGDTTTAMSASLAAFYLRIPVAHVEAGLRTHDPLNPFPEEINRKIISAVASRHFAPTQTAADNLQKEGIPLRRICVTGNTIIDALLDLDKKALDLPSPVPLDPLKKMILVTCHRRENFGRPLDEICGALDDIVRKHRDVEIVYPVHPNPNIDRVVRKKLGGRRGIHLIRPLDYLSFIRLMKASYLILTDSGGVQEEAPAFSKPVLILRKVTERPEGVKAGIARVVPPERKNIYHETRKLLSNPAAYRRMAAAKNPYGDGKAAKRIVSVLRKLIREF